MQDIKLIVGAYLFDGFELMSACGPLDFLGKLPGSLNLEIVTVSGKPAASEQGPEIVASRSLADDPRFDILFLPSGSGAREEVENSSLMHWLVRASKEAKYIVSLGSGSALLARAGLLDGIRATTDKNAVEWTVTQGPKVNWVKQTPWTEDGKFFTAPGLSTGLDMTLTLIKRIFDERVAQDIAFRSGYEWRGGLDWDTFAMAQGLV